VQESLTNARKHAAGHPVLVRLEATAALVVVRVVNAGVRSPSGVGGGHGLVGMRERVEAVGGRLVAGWTDGEFAVEATLPRTGPR
jgi:signal transduction histidine kinase